MKRLISLLLLCCLLVSCSGPAQQPGTKISAEEFRVKRYENLIEKGYEVEFDPEVKDDPNWMYMDITPDDIYKKLGCQIFKNTATFGTFVYFGEQLYGFANSVGGYGVIDMELCDFDGDGQLDILYSSSHGTGFRWWEIGIFNFTTMTDELLFISAAQTDIVEIFWKNVVLERTAEECYDIYTANPKLVYDENVRLDYLKTTHEKENLVGKIVNENGKPKVSLITD